MSVKSEKPFLVRLREIPPEGLRRSFDLGGDWGVRTLAGTDASVSPGGLRAEVDLQRAHQDVVAKGRLDGQLEVPCGRCLTTATLDVDVPFQVTFVPASDAPGDGGGGDELEVDEDLADLATYVHDEVDLDAPLREEVLLALPIAHLCREDCKGLCASCGQNLNEGPCDCRPVQPEERWSALRNIKL